MDSAHPYVADLNPNEEARATWNGLWPDNYNCVVRFDRHYVATVTSWPKFCTTMAHEYGHTSWPGAIPSGTLGQAWHSSNPANLMFWSSDRAIFPPCR